MLENETSGSVFGCGSRAICSGVNSTKPTVGGIFTCWENRGIFSRLMPNIPWMPKEAKNAIQIGCCHESLL